MFLLSQFGAKVSSLHNGTLNISEKGAREHTQKPGQTATRKSSQTFALAGILLENNKDCRGPPESLGLSSWNSLPNLGRRGHYGFLDEPRLNWTNKITELNFLGFCFLPRVGHLCGIWEISSFILVEAYSITTDLRCYSCYNSLRRCIHYPWEHSDKTQNLGKTPMRKPSQIFVPFAELVGKNRR